MDALVGANLISSGGHRLVNRTLSLLVLLIVDLLSVTTVCHSQEPNATMEEVEKA